MTETPDLPCPKCGSQRTEMIYCNLQATYIRAVREYQKTKDELAARGLPSLPVHPTPYRWRDGQGREFICFGPELEHFHRGCLRCEYRWITEDVVTG